MKKSYLYLNNISDDYIIKSITKRHIFLVHDICGLEFRLAKSSVYKQNSKSILCTSCKYVSLDYSYVESKTNTKKRTFIHKICGTEFSVNWTTFLTRNNNNSILCTKCNPLIIRTEFKDIIPDDYIMLSEKRIDQLYHLKHLTCNTDFYVNRKVVSRRYNDNAIICVKCNPLKKPTSQAEKTLTNFVKQIYGGDIIENTRRIIKPYELDIYFPELNKAIEFQGDYYHCNPIKNAIPKHKNVEKVKVIDALKRKLCSELGINLLEIWEHDWRKNKDDTKLLIEKFLKP